MTITSKAPFLRLPAKIKKLGATKVDRTGDRSFNLGFALVDGDFTLPGNGTQIVAALREHFGTTAKITWQGMQCKAINVKFL